MLVLITKGIVLYIISYVLWRILRHIVVKTDLDNVPGPVSHSFWKGNLGKLFNTDAWQYHEELRQKYGKVVRIDALLGDKQLYVYDPKALHHIIVKDQYIYERAGSSIEGARLMFGDGLLASLGERHRRQRKMMNPVFSISHMRGMIPIFYEVTQKLQTALNSQIANGPQEIDMLRWMTRTALELIGQSGLGYSFDSLTDESDSHPYSNSVKQLVPTVSELLIPRTYLLSSLVKIGTPRFRRLIVDVLPWKSLQKLRDIVDIMHNTSTEIFEEKKKALEEGNEAVLKQVGRGKDILSILMRANIVASEEDKLPDREVLGQMSTFIFAAMDTTSNALSRILHLLATHIDVQEKLRQEVTSSSLRNGGYIPYDELVSLPLLDAVCRETLRLYPPVSYVHRTTCHEVVLPLSTPIRGVDGREMQEIIVPTNTNVIVSILGSNRDPTLWGPDAHEWKPERWLSPLPEKLTEAHIPGIYSHLMTFLGGGRACIGFKFSQLEMKVVLSVLLTHTRFSPPGKEIVWEMNTIASPTVKGARNPSLPLKVTSVHTHSA
ncbi:cytochrome P450 [Collybia nuda]|uniref:Cytochrome P450 n=1 Tax=Collybia nuda TaxID=64659 RepID=A0A9P5YCY0_9AGAR|nr:cytochrome P450 [Collybia nuda]